MLKQSRQRRSREAPTPDWVAERIRARRLALGLTLGQLSERAGLRSPSFVFHLERGDKAPSEATAVALARALGDDVDLYRAWAKALNRADLATALAAAATLQRLAGEVGVGPPAGEPRGEESALPTRDRVGATSREGSAHALLRVPVIAEGADPGDGLLPASDVIETLRLDPRLLPPLDQLRRVFAYRVGEHWARRLPELLAPGDYALFSRGMDPFAEGHVHAVRVGRRVELSRVASDGSTFSLSPSPGFAGFSVAASDVTLLREVLVGRMVATIRKW